MLNAEIFMGTLLTEKPLKQEQSLLNEIDKLYIDSVQNLFDQSTKRNMYTMVKFSKSATANTVNAGNNIYLTSNLDEKS